MPRPGRRRLGDGGDPRRPRPDAADRPPGLTGVARFPRRGPLTLGRPGRPTSRRRVTEEAPPGLPAQQTRLDHAAQQGRRSVRGFAVLLMQRLPDRRHRVEADEVGQVQWPHGVCAPGRHPGVDVLGCRRAGAGHADRRQQVRHQEAVDDEAGPVLGDGRPVGSSLTDGRARGARPSVRNTRQPDHWTPQRKHASSHEQRKEAFHRRTRGARRY
jgi:hypothetical protein